jgi:hypothetical protein
MNTDVVAEIKERLWAGEKPKRIAISLGIPVYRVYDVKRGVSGFAVPWPDGSTGAMDDRMIAKIAEVRGWTGVSREQRRVIELEVKTAREEEWDRVLAEEEAKLEAWRKLEVEHAERGEVWSDDLERFVPR